MKLISRNTAPLLCMLGAAVMITFALTRQVRSLDAATYEGVGSTFPKACAHEAYYAHWRNGWPIHVEHHPDATLYSIPDSHGNWRFVCATFGPMTIPAHSSKKLPIQLNLKTGVMEYVETK